MNRIRTSLLLTSFFLTLAPSILASTTWYVDGVNGSDGNDCTSAQAACKTIGHGISLASSGDSIKVASATYTELLGFAISLNVIGSGASTTIIDGQFAGVVITTQPGAHVTLSDITIQNGLGGIDNQGTLTINYSTVSGNVVSVGGPFGGGIFNTGTLTINNSTISGNQVGRRLPGYGGGIYNWPTGFVTINNSTISGNVAFCGYFACGVGAGGGIYNRGKLHVNNSTIATNLAYGYRSYRVAYSQGGGIFSGGGTLEINSSTLSGNSAGQGGGIFGGATFQNSILANNGGGNCYSTPAVPQGSSGYNLSSDSSCNFSNVGDLNNTDPKLGTLGSNGGPTQTIPLLSGSPAIDRGNPSGCADGQGNLLKTDQRGMPRPDSEDKGGCDLGAYETQSN